MGVYLNQKFYERIEEEKEYICVHGYTLRQVAKLMGISKSTVHIDVTERLRKHSNADYLKVKEVLNEHFATRHIRGGKATQEKYRKLKGK